MKLVVVALVLGLFAPVARAERWRWVGTGAAVAGRGGMDVEAIVEGGLRPGPHDNAPVWLHALAAAGAWSREDYGDATTTRLGFGVEARPCGHRICAVGGVDLQYLHVDDALHGLVIGGHLGLEAGTARVRGRVTVERTTAVSGGLSTFDGMDTRFTVADGYCASLGAMFLF